MKILIIGTGYVGTTSGLVFCEMGHKVTGLDLDKVKLNSLQSGKLHFFEPGLDLLLQKHIKEKNISFTNDSEKAIKENDVIFICVGTPQEEDGSANLVYVKSVAQAIGKYMNRYKVIVNKSTVPVGTAKLVEKWIKNEQESDIQFDVISNPEFLREGSALQDALNPDRIIIGYPSERSLNIMKELYSESTCPLVTTNHEAAELIKYAANSFLAMKISYINEIARLCDTLNINVNDVANGIGLDHRIGGHFLKAGIGYGGSCFPKDVSELIFSAKKYNISFNIMESVRETNEFMPIYFLNKIISNLGTLKNKKLAILGLSFKPNTDDIRESPAFKIINRLIESDAIFKVHDPVVTGKMDSGLYQCKTIEETVQGTDAVLICTDWEVYKEMDWEKVKDSMNNPSYIFDGRNMLNPIKMREIGFVYFGIGNY